MRIRKTKISDRGEYRYPVSIPDGIGGYKTTYEVIRPGENGVTEEMIKLLHSMDDSEVYNNVKNGHPPITEFQREEKRIWEKDHPGEKYLMNWNLSTDYIFKDSDFGSNDKSMVQCEMSFNPFEDEPESVLRLREIIVDKMTQRQREAFELIAIQGYTRTEAAYIMGISIKVAKTHFDKAIECIKKYY